MKYLKVWTNNFGYGLPEPSVPASLFYTVYMSQEKLHSILETCSACIAYLPFHEEVEYSTFSFPQKINFRKIVLSNDKNTDPFKTALELEEKLRNEKVCIFIPGTAFDVFGTRHGRGAGWYDRLLSRVPKEWIRIGVTDVPRFSHERLTRESWDEPMDWIIVHDSSTFSWNVCEASN